MTRHISDAAYAVTEWIARRMARHQLNHERNYEAEEVRKRFRPLTNAPRSVWVFNERPTSGGTVYVAFSSPPGVEYVRRET
jgi:hypothetical protein